MIVITVEFPDERVNWIDHLHVSFKSQAAAKRWLSNIERFGLKDFKQENRVAGWKCPICRWETRTGGRKPMAAVGRDGGLVDVE